MNYPHQRKGSKSNAQVGRDFEMLAKEHLEKHGIKATQNFKVSIGIREPRKPHSFDLGASNPPVVIECKSHRWTEGNKVPSAKLSVWNEAMYYLSLVPNGTRRIFFVLYDKRVGSGESLAEYYIRTYSHLIPKGTEIWEFDETTKTHTERLLD